MLHIFNRQLHIRLEFFFIISEVIVVKKWKMPGKTTAKSKNNAEKTAAPGRGRPKRNVKPTAKLKECENLDNLIDTSLSKISGKKHMKINIQNPKSTFIYTVSGPPKIRSKQSKSVNAQISQQQILLDDSNDEIVMMNSTALNPTPKKRASKHQSHKDPSFVGIEENTSISIQNFDSEIEDPDRKKRNSNRKHV